MGGLAALYAASYGALLFTGPLAPYAAKAAGACIFSAFVLGVISAVLTRLPVSIPIPQDAPIAILAGSVAAVGVRAATSGPVNPDAALAYAASAALITAGCFVIIGRAKLARFLRFIPYPVVGGLVAGTGWLITKGAMTVLVGKPLSLASLPELGRDMTRWAPALLGALGVLWLSKRKPTPLLVPAAVAVGCAVFYFVATLGGHGMVELRREGWLLGPFPAGAIWRPLGPDAFLAAWRALDPKAVGDILAMAAMAAISALLNLTAVELTSGAEVDLDREIARLGVANLGSAAGGGLTGYPSLSLSSLAMALGGGKSTPLTTALVCGSVLIGGAGALSFAPRPVMGGLLLYMGIGLLERWLAPWRERFPRAERMLIVAIVAIVALSGFLSGVVVGILASAILFAIEYGRAEVVRSELTGQVHRSRTERSAAEDRILEARGSEFWVLRLQGFIFFGSAHHLVERILRQMRDRPGVRYLALDMGLVTGLDSSALFSFERLRRKAAGFDVEVILSDVPQEVAARMSAQPSLASLRRFTDLDHALEWWEDLTLSEKADDISHPEAEELIRSIAPHLAERRLELGERLFAQGDVSDGLYFVVSGKLEARLDEAIRLKTLGPGTVVGEMCLFNDEPRSASVVAVQESRLLHLTHEAFEAMAREEHDAQRRLHRFLVGLLAERLRHANRERALLWG